LPEMPAVHDSVEVPDPPLIDVEDRVQVRLVELVVTARVTVPVNPLTGLIVIDDVPATPTETATLIGLAAMVKSGATVT